MRSIHHIVFQDRTNHMELAYAALAGTAIFFVGGSALIGMMIE